MLETPSDKIALAIRVYRLYRELMEHDPNGGKLLLAGCGPADRTAMAGPAGPLRLPADGLESVSASDALVRAANIAGAATLLVCEDAKQAREQVRSGACDFLVTTLDEALRILKNELRRKQPVAVCLLGERAGVTAECVARGVQPDLLTVAEPTLEARGARVVRGLEETKWLSGTIVLWTVLPGRLEDLQQIDALAVATVEVPRQAAARRWLSRAPQYLGRDWGRGSGGERLLVMEKSEGARFAEAVRHATSNGRLAPGVRVECRDQTSR